MRIIGGTLGGRTLRAPRGLGTRPTTDMVRQALFNILGPPPPGARVLDLYAGTGALGIEALSRGAARAVFVESDRRAGQVLRENLQALDLLGRSEIVARPVQAALPALCRAAPGDAPFHWIFADPPYRQGLVAALLRDLGEAPGAALLSPEGLLVVEYAEGGQGADRPPDRQGCLCRVDQRCYGQTGLSFYAPHP